MQASLAETDKLHPPSGAEAVKVVGLEPLARADQVAHLATRTIASTPDKAAG
jgi:hypothetical protein